MSLKGIVSASTRSTARQVSSLQAANPAHFPQHPISTHIYFQTPFTATPQASQQSFSSESALQITVIQNIADSAPHPDSGKKMG
jgi:hypothetical protein